VTAGSAPAVATVRLFSTLAAKGVLDELAPRYERTSGRIAILFEPTVALLRRIEAGETADAAILTENAVARLLREGIFATGSRVDLARSRIGVAVRVGAPKPEIGSVEAFTQTLLGARSVAYSRDGASGIFFAGLLQRLGIAEQVNARARIIPSGFAAELVARGEADLAVQQISELLVISGVELVGPLPDAVQSASMFSGAVFRDAVNAAQAFALLGFLASPGVAGVYADKGLEPMRVPTEAPPRPGSGGR
jgi:molybdate transport system substrate-binding protein